MAITNLIIADGQVEEIKSSIAEYGHIVFTATDSQKKTHGASGVMAQRGELAESAEELLLEIT